MPDELNFFLRYVFYMPYRMLSVIHPLEYPPTKHSSSRFQIFLKRRTSWNMRLDHGKFLLHFSKGLEGGQHQTHLTFFSSRLTFIRPLLLCLRRCHLMFQKQMSKLAMTPKYLEATFQNLYALLVNVASLDYTMV